MILSEGLKLVKDNPGLKITNGDEVMFWSPRFDLFYEEKNAFYITSFSAKQLMSEGWEFLGK